MNANSSQRRDESRSQAGPSPAQLVVDKLTVEFSTKAGTVTALHNIDLEVRPNEILAIVGASGCGKSTLLRAIGGLIAPSAGTISILGQPVRGPGADRGMVFQSYSLYPWRNVARNVAFGLELKGMPANEIDSRVRDLLEVVGLSDRHDAFPSELSGGMRQRVAIARALANSPDMLLLDEPFGALDAHTKDRMHSFLRDVWEKTHTTFILVTHDVEEAVFVSNRVCMMSANPGRIDSVLEIDLPAHRDLDLKFKPEFSNLRRIIHNFINQSEQD